MASASPLSGEEKTEDDGGAGPNGAEATPEEIRNLLYSYENLRKQTGEEEEAADKAEAEDTPTQD